MKEEKTKKGRKYYTYFIIELKIKIAISKYQFSLHKTFYRTYIINSPISTYNKVCIVKEKQPDKKKKITQVLHQKFSRIQKYTIYTNISNI